HIDDEVAGNRVGFHVLSPGPQHYSWTSVRNRVAGDQVKIPSLNAHGVRVPVVVFGSSDVVDEAVGHREAIGTQLLTVEQAVEPGSVAPDLTIKESERVLTRIDSEPAAVEESAIVERYVSRRSRERREADRND